MTAPTCVRCGRPTADGYADVACRDRAAGHLAEIAELTPDARAVAYGQARHSAGGGSGKPGSRSPGNDDALDVLGAVRNELGGWVRVVAEERGQYPPTAPHGHETLAVAARFLCEHLEWFRHRVEVDEMLGDVERCARRMRGIVNGPAPQRYLGPCGTRWVPDPVDDEFGTEVECDGDVYGRPGADNGRCKTCGAEVDQAERRIWLDEQVGRSDLAWTASGIADALGLNVKTVRAWATERRSETGHLLRTAKLGTFWRNADGHLAPWVEPSAQLTEAQRKAELKARGDRLHYVGDVRQLATEAAERRAEEAARREREEVGVAS